MRPKNMCQSCGMPLSQDPKKGGTEADGSKSSEYCSYCYKDGKFFNPDMTAKEMQKFVKKELAKKGFLMKLLAPLFVMQIPKLKRWKR